MTLWEICPEHNKKLKLKKFFPENHAPLRENNAKSIGSLREALPNGANT
jgi:hypothetical protein